MGARDWGSAHEHKPQNLKVRGGKEPHVGRIAGHSAGLRRDWLSAVHLSYSYDNSRPWGMSLGPFLRLELSTLGKGADNMRNEDFKNMMADMCLAWIRNTNYAELKGWSEERAVTGNDGND